ncbi:MAG: TIGR00282 family metallophosphoesterase [Oscillospiraceae bacterium]
MKILFIGDIVGENGLWLLKKGLPLLKKELQPHVTIVNGENSHRNGTGLTKREADTIFSLGGDVITGGNHSLRRCGIELYEENGCILCPQNFNFATEGCGVCVVDLGKTQLCVVNLIGTVFLEAHKNPFFAADEIVEKYKDMPIFVDFHAEATSEKYALGHYLDGRVCAIVGTHTHVQTNDEQILPKGTAYITDVGCVCSQDSVLGVKKELAIQKQKYICPVLFEVQEGGGFINGVVIEIDDKSRKAISIEKIHKNFN